MLFLKGFSNGFLSGFYPEKPRKTQKNLEKPKKPLVFLTQTLQTTENRNI